MGEKKYSVTVKTKTAGWVSFIVVGTFTFWQLYRRYKQAGYEVTHQEVA